MKVLHQRLPPAQTAKMRIVQWLDQKIIPEGPNWDNMITKNPEVTDIWIGTATEKAVGSISLVKRFPNSVIEKSRTVGEILEACNPNSQGEKVLYIVCDLPNNEYVPADEPETPVKQVKKAAPKASRKVKETRKEQPPSQEKKPDRPEFRMPTVLQETDDDLPDILELLKSEGEIKNDADETKNEDVVDKFTYVNDSDEEDQPEDDADVIDSYIYARATRLLTILGGDHPC